MTQRNISEKLLVERPLKIGGDTPFFAEFIIFGFLGPFIEGSLSNLINDVALVPVSNKLPGSHLLGRLLLFQGKEHCG